LVKLMIVIIVIIVIIIIAPFCSQIFKKIFTIGGKGALTPLPKSCERP